MKIVIFDADGVVVRPKELFSQTYARSHGLDPESFQAFFTGDFSQATIGMADLKELLMKHHPIWQWDDDPQLLLDQWFAAENQLDTELMKFIEWLRARGTSLYMATDQEKYRAAYLRKVMFPGVFDDFFISCELGVNKKDAAFWEKVLQQLHAENPAITPDDIYYFDDAQHNIDQAAAHGISAYLYKDTEQVKSIING